jgi:hypothetical protein
VAWQEGLTLRRAETHSLAQRYGVSIETIRKWRKRGAAYNVRRQRVLEGKTPDQVVAERLTAKPALAKDQPSGRANPCDIPTVRLIADRAKEMAQPNTGLILEIKWKTAAASCLTGFRRVPHRQWDRYGRQHRKPRVRDRQRSQ